jgi:uncharacterized protein (DUF1810 family)
MTAPDDPFDLGRFVTAQDSGDVYTRALVELRQGRKRTHWMWFVFPQIAGLGASPTSRYYAIGSLEEARAYLRHDVLGPRLCECAKALTDTRTERGVDLRQPRRRETLLFHDPLSPRRSVTPYA